PPTAHAFRWRLGGLRVPRRRGSPISKPLHGADGAGALQGTGRQWPMRLGGDLEGCGPSQPWFAVIHTASRRRRSARPPGNRPAMAHAFGWRPGGLRSLAAVVRRDPHRFTAPTERTPSREPAGNGPCVWVETWRAAVPRSRGSPNPHRFTAPTERAPSREPAGNGPCVSVETWRSAVRRRRVVC